MKTLTNKDLEYLMAKTLKVAPNNPSGQGMSAETIKKLYYEGFQILFNWIKGVQADFIIDGSWLNEYREFKDLVKTKYFTINLNANVSDGVISGVNNTGFLNDYLNREYDKVAVVSFGNYVLVNAKIENGTPRTIKGIATDLENNIYYATINVGIDDAITGSLIKLSTENDIENLVAQVNTLPTKTYVDTELNKKIDKSSMGVNNGVATLDENGRIPSTQLPSYVDDVLEFASRSNFPATGETDKIYVAKDTNITYRWGGSTYVEISQSLALGETSSTAYAGDKGKANADNIAQLQKDVAKKVDIDIDCDHEYEITGKTGHEYAVAVPDGQVLVKRINGQTRRKSLNLLDHTKIVTSNSFSYSNGVYTATDVGSGAWLFNDYVIYGQFTVALTLLSKPTNLATFTLYNVKDDGNDVLGEFNGINSYETNKIYTISVTSLSLANVRIALWNNGVNPTFKFKIWAVEGEYTANTMPPFEPYDDTLVNSKCNLKSSGRNLIDINKLIEGRNAKGLTSTYKDGYTYTTTINSDTRVWGYSSAELYMTLPAGTYKIVGQWGSSNTNNAVQIFDSNNQLIKSIGNSTSIASNSFTLSQLTEVGIITKSYNTSLSLSLYYGTDHDNSFEPYEESSMLVDRELGEFDYIDNVGHLLVKQTSQVFTFDGSSDENWAIVGSQSSGNTNLFRWQGVSGSLRFIGNSLYSNIFGKGNESIWGNDIECIGNTAIEILIRLSKEKCPDLNSFKTWLASANLQVVFKLSTPTTEPINLEAGYQVWNSGLQIQETETLPYILEKEYAVSLYSQVLAITSIVNSIPDDVASKSWVEAYIATQSLTEKNYLKRDDFVIATSGNGNIYKHNLELVSEDKQTRILITLINKTSTAITRIIDIVSHFSNIEYGGRFPASGLFVEDGVSYLVYYIRDVGGVILKVGLASFTGTRTEKDVNNVTINDRVETLLVASTE